MAFQLDFGEERALREALARNVINGKAKGPGAELRRAYDAIVELHVGDNTALHQARDEYSEMYLQAHHAYTSGDFQFAELMARALRHLCRAAWFDAKVKYLEGHSGTLPHLSGLNEGAAVEIERGIAEVVNRLSRMKLTGLADRFGGRSRKHLERIESMKNHNSLLADTFMKAAYEYCLATEALHDLEFKQAAA
jgi:hypothetical protein